MALQKTVVAGVDNSNNYSSSKISAMSITRTVKNTSGIDIVPLKPIVNGGWDDTDDCMIVRLPNDEGDIIIGVTIDAINTGCTKVIRYVASGLISGIDTSIWAVNKFLYAKTNGSITDDPTEEGVIAQEIGLVLRSHATEGEIYVSTMADQVKYIQLAISVLSASNAPAGSNLPGDSFTLKGGSGNGTGDGGGVELVPGVKGAGGANDGTVDVLQAGTKRADGKGFSFWHDGINSFIKSLYGSLINIGKFIVRSTIDTDGTKQIELSHDGTNAIIEPKAGDTVHKGKFRVLRPTGTLGIDEVQIYSDGTDGYIVPKKGVLKTDNKDLDVGTGKIVADSIKSNKMVDTTDITKVLSFVLSSIATGATRTITMPNSNVDLSNIHTHSNKANLDNINQDLGTGNSVTFAGLKIATGGRFSASSGELSLNYNFGGGVLVFYAGTATGVFSVNATGQIYSAALTANQIVETDGSKKLISAAKNNGYNLALTVNTVSPTAPNRTIKLNIGGTDYYLAAKTTND